MVDSNKVSSAFVLDSQKLLLRIHTEFNNLLNVNESADVRKEVEPICFLKKKNTIVNLHVFNSFVLTQVG